MAVVDPTHDQVAALAQSPHAGPVQMINLLQFNPDGGRAGYERYMEAALPHLDAVGARAIAFSAVRQVVIGEDARPWWDAILTVEYPSIQAFLEMVTSDGYRAISHHRTAALSRAELVATVPGTLEG